MLVYVSAWRVAYVEGKKMHTNDWCENLKEVSPLEDLGVDENTGLIFQFNKMGGRSWKTEQLLALLCSM